MIKDIIYIDNKPELVSFRAVAVKHYGSDGCMPIYEDDCPYKGEISCVSSSGDSICGGYMGHAGNYVVKCSEKEGE